MSTKRSTIEPGVGRMSVKEKLVVQTIVSKLDSVYRNSYGKPEYARYMDQVMKDLFGVKKFTKTLNRAVHNESLMISLMRRLGVPTLWEIVRSKEHYKMLCTLVAMDSQIVKNTNKAKKLEPNQRNTGKGKKLIKEIKHEKKMYHECIKSMRAIFDIKRTDDRPDALLDQMSEWLDKYDDNGRDIFDYDDYDAFSSTDSMDDYVASILNKGKKRTGRPINTNVGAFDLFDENTDLDDEDDEDEDDMDEDDIGGEPIRVSGSAKANRDMDKFVAVINDGFTMMADRLGENSDVLAHLSNSIDIMFSNGSDVSNASYDIAPTEPDETEIEKMIKLSEENTRPSPHPITPESERPIPTEIPEN